MKKKPQGLCLTCNNAATCINYCNSNKPIWYCEEFECCINHCKDTKQGAGKPDNNNTFSNTPPEEDVTYMGLCSNCENRKACKLQIPESGVWHCEEYK